MTKSTLGPGIAMMMNAARPNASSCCVVTTAIPAVCRRTWPRRPSLSQRSDQQRGAAPGRAGQHHRRLVVPSQGEALPQLLGHHVDAALLDREPADAPRAEGGL